MINNGTQLSNILTVPSLAMLLQPMRSKQKFFGLCSQKCSLKEKILLLVFCFFPSMLLLGTQMWWLELLHPHLQPCKRLRIT